MDGARYDVDRSATSNEVVIDWPRRRRWHGANSSPETFVVRMDDDSMAPDLPRDRWAFVDPDEPMAQGLLVGVDDPETGKVTVRRLAVEDGRRVLRTAGPGWPDMVVTADNETLIRGTELLVGAPV